MSSQIPLIFFNGALEKWAKICDKNNNNYIDETELTLFTLGIAKVQNDDNSSIFTASEEKALDAFCKNNDEIKKLEAIVDNLSQPASEAEVSQNQIPQNSNKIPAELLPEKLSPEKLNVTDMNNAGKSVYNKETGITTVYDENGKIVEEKNIILIADKASADYKYNEKGQVTRCTTHTNEAWFYIDYEYDDKDRLVKSTLCSADGNPKKYEIFTYDKEGNYLGTEEYDINGKKIK